MVSTIANAAAAYANAAARATSPGMPARDEETPSFGEVLDQAARQSINTMKGAEKLSAEAVLGRADLTDVVTAVSNAEVTLQTVTAVRDKVVTAYQEILRMPI